MQVRRCRRARGAHGQAVIAVAMTMVVLVIALLVVARVGRTVIDRARAQTAADAAALAGVNDGRARARDVAERNGAHLVDFDAVGAEVDVTVQVGSVRASARARLESSANPDP